MNIVDRMKLIDPFTNESKNLPQLSRITVFLKIDSIVHLIFIHLEGSMVGSQIDLSQNHNVLKLINEGLSHNTNFICILLNLGLISQEAIEWIYF